MQVEELPEVGATDEGPVAERDAEAAGRRIEEVENDREEGEETEDQEVRGEEDPGKPALAEARLQPSHRPLDQIHQQPKGSEEEPSQASSGGALDPGCHGPGDSPRPAYFLAAAVACSMSAVSRFIASSTVSSPTIAWVTRCTVALNIARLSA